MSAAQAQGGVHAAAPGAAGAFERRLVALMAARLALALLSLGIALAVDTAVDLGIEDWRGLYGTVALAFVATALYGIALPGVRHKRRFAAINVATDIGMVSALVHFSGTADTVFAFLYLLVAVYGALLFDRRGALAVAALAALAYGGVLALGRALGPVPGSAAALPRAMLVAAWAIHSLATVAAAALASVLSAELRRTGEALRQRTHDLDRLWRLHRHTVESLMSGLLTTDPHGLITSFNPEAERITGLRAHQALGRGVDEVLPGVRDKAIARAGAAGGARSRVRLAYRSSRGGSYLGVGAYVLRDDDGQPSGHVVIFQDVTEVVEMERELRRSERLAAVGQLSASMAHEIRNPLAAISGSIQVLRREGGGPRAAQESRRLMDIVLRETDRLNRLLTEFLEYARPGPLRLEALPLDEAVAELLAIFEASRPEGLELRVDLEPGLRLHADPGQLRQLLWNLLLNAAQAMPEGGTIALGARAAGQPQDAPAGRRKDREEGGWVEIAVRDAGVGIPAEALDRIFDPFFTTKPGGTGLGLATVHRIVEEHGGSIRVHSADGKGTTFQLRLPRARAMSSGGRILVVDDERSMQEFLEIFLRGEGYEVATAGDAASARGLLESDEFDVVITDIQMPGGSGLELLHAAREASPDAMVIVMTAYASTETAIAAMKDGAYDYLTKPFRVDEIRLVVEKALEKKSLSRENRRLRTELRSRSRSRRVIGSSAAMQRVFDLVSQVADSRANVLVTGESGTGKEMIARAIHEMSERRDGPFIVVNCAAIPENLLESELFGHVRGAFTGALHNKEGLFELADGGTLFLDEVGDLPLALQVKVLRAIQEKSFRRVGGTHDQQVDARIVAATNRRLEEEVVRGRFREDLYYRLNVIEIPLPPLRERRDDVALLVDHFIEKYARELGKDVKGMSDDALALLVAYRFPGNVRELENVIERAAALTRAPVIQVESLPRSVLEREEPEPVARIPREGVDLDKLMEEYERSLILEALRPAGGVKKRAAKLLGISFRSLRYRLEKLGIDEGRSREEDE